MYGLANIILSSLSKIPPCPGIILPLSFTFDSRLNLDSIKSPKCTKNTYNYSYNKPIWSS